MKPVKKYLLKIILWIYERYCQLKSFIRQGDYEKKHFLFQKDGSRVTVSMKSHHDFIDEVQEAIDRFEHRNNNEEYVKYALGQAIGGCAHIIISRGDRSVIFWTARGKLEFIFQVKTEKSFRPYYFQIIGMLADIDFVRDSLAPTIFSSIIRFKANRTYEVDEAGDTKSITGYFNKMIPEASKFTMQVFEDVFGVNRGKLKISVG